jgi:hypothetical protein
LDATDDYRACFRDCRLWNAVGPRPWLSCVEHIRELVWNHFEEFETHKLYFYVPNVRAVLTFVSDAGIAHYVALVPNHLYASNVDRVRFLPDDETFTGVTVKVVDPKSHSGSDSAKPTVSWPRVARLSLLLEAHLYTSHAPVTKSARKITSCSSSPKKMMRMSCIKFYSVEELEPCELSSLTL